MLKNKKLKKLIRDPKKFAIDALEKKSASSLLTKKAKKLLRDPSLYFADYLKKRPRLQSHIENYSKIIPLPKYHYQLYSQYKALNYPVKAENALLSAIALDPKPLYYYHLGISLSKKKQWWQAIDAFDKALTPRAPKHWYKPYALALTQMNRYKESAKAWGETLKNSNDANDWFSYGYTLELSQQSALSSEAYVKAIVYDKDKNAKELGIGIFHEKNGQWLAANKAYKAFSEKRPLDTAILYRLALALEKCYQWEESEKIYFQAITLSPESIDWYYKLGFVRERQGKYTLAAEAYNHAAKNRKIHTPYWYYRLGYVLNKSTHYKASCDAFLMMKKIVLPQETQDKDTRESLSPRKDIIHSHDFLSFFIDENTTKLDILNLIKEHFEGSSEFDKLSALLFSDKQYKEKIYKYIVKIQKEKEASEEKERQCKEQLLLKVTILKNTLDKDTTRDDLWYKLAKIYTELKAYEKASLTFKHLIRRKNNFDGNLYASLGQILALQGKYEEASEIFKHSRILKEPHGVTEEVFHKNLEFKKLSTYTEYYNTLEIEDSLIMYESFTANNMSGNPYAIFTRILALKEYQDMLHIWAVNDLSRVPERFKNHQNIIFIKRDSDAYLRYLCQAKYLINNSGFPPYYIRKSNQKYLNTWHGTPLKTLGKEQKYKFFDHKRTQRNFLQASHIISPNSHTSEVLIHSYDLKNIYTGKVAETGYPRIDNSQTKTEEEQTFILNLLGINRQKPIVLYAPTWRGTLQDIALDTQKLESDISRLNTLDCQLLFRGHSLLEETLVNSNIDCISVPPIIDTNDLLSITDILITDYSSIFFDFIAMKKPILYYIYDLESYEEERGLYFKMKEMPGEKCLTIGTLYSALEKAVSTMDIEEEAYEKSIAKYCKYDDGNATKRVIDFFFNDNNEYLVHSEDTVKDNNNVIIFPGSLLPNGITTSFANLINLIDKKKMNPIIPFSPNQIEKSDKGKEAFRTLDTSLDFIPRYGNMLMTLEERYVRFKAEKNNYANLTIEEYQLLKTMYQREFKRIFGNSKISKFINFSGYDEFWANISAFGGEVDERIIYQHNDLFGEWKMKYPKMEIIFKLYAFHNKIVSVSENTMHHNRKNLGDLFNISKEKFIYCDNLQNPKNIIHNSKKALEDLNDEKIFNNAKVFINIARLSPEKDQEKLIRAFAKVSKIHENIKLINLGSGPLENELRQLIKKLNLSKKVFLLGQKGNPYPYLEKSDCFILSSNHEGQPMTLFEAMILEKATIATDIVGNRSVLEGRPGHLVENSEEGLIQGMLNFLEGNYVEDALFDYKEYNQNALQMFYTKVLG